MDVFLIKVLMRTESKSFERSRIILECLKGRVW